MEPTCRPGNRSMSKLFAALLQDLHYSVRSLLRSPGFAVAVVLTLALGIGTNTAMFNLIDAYYLKSLFGITEPDRLVDVRSTLSGRITGQMTYLDYADLRERNHVFSGLMAYCPTVVDVGRGGDTRRVQAALVSSNYFSVLGVRPSLGRTFLPEEERPAGAHPVAVLSHRLWQRSFHADTGLVGKTVVLNSRSYTVVGIAAPGFRHTSDQAFDIWLPLAMYREANPGILGSVGDRIFRWLTVVGRLVPGANITQARAEMSILAHQLEHSGSRNGAGFGISLKPSQPSLAGDTYALLLIGSVAVLFLIVCANLSNLYLARADVRRKEIVTRLALGAPRCRVLQQLLVESVVLGMLGGAVALPIGPPAANALMAWSTAEVQEFPDPVDLSINGNVVLFVLAVSVLSGIVLGLGPALRATRLDIGAGLRAGAGDRIAARCRVRSLLLVSQLSLSLLLLSGSGLLFRTLRNLQRFVSVHTPEQVLLLSVQPSHQQYTQVRQREFFRQLLDRVERLPGVRAATITRDISLGDASFFPEQVAAERAMQKEGGSWTSVAYAVVTPGFFQTVGPSLAQGRDFADQDREGSPPVVIVNNALAQRFWPDGNVLGRVLRIADEKRGREVIGLARDRPTEDGPQPFLYEPLYQRDPWAGSIHVLHIRTLGSPLGLATAVRREAAALDVNLPLFNSRTLDREIAGSRFFERVAIGVVGASGLSALLLASVGLYGVMRYWISQRMHEIGVRMALGASARNVLLIVVGQGMKLALMGAGIGLAAALVLNRVWANQLYGVRPTDPEVLSGAALILMATALAASYMPARRAARVDPAAVLRCE
jgi:predicted permease